MNSNSNLNRVTLGEYRGGTPTAYRAEIHRAGCKDLGKTARKFGFGWVETHHTDVDAAIGSYMSDDLDGLASEEEVRTFPCTTVLR